jgi:endonuclease YncB( thermonuclease family)
MILALTRPQSVGAFAAGLIFLMGFGAGAAFGPIGARSNAPIETPAALQDTVVPGGHAADVLRIIDGDTFEARVHVWPGLAVTTRVRLRGIDAAELKARCGDEYAKAQSAREALVGLLAQGGVRIADIGPDKYEGRIVANASTRTTQSVSRALLDAGVVRSYNGGHRDGWCG